MRSCAGSAPPRSRCGSGADEATERATAIQVELARLDAEAEEAQRRLDEAGADEPAEGDDRDRARDAGRATRRPPRGARQGESAREGGVRGGEGAPRGARRRSARISRRRWRRSRSCATSSPRRCSGASARRSRRSPATSRRWRRRCSPAARAGCASSSRVEDDEGNELEAGIEVELRPAGKRITRLTLLSGGEKALGAISFLFALFLAKPCPFYLLDEVEAALDDANVTRFVELLRRYSDRAQFIVITHQKRTMEAADVLYGVTMGGDGVSQVVSRRLPQHDQVAAATA